jgi:outer membrane protein assembly factor BamB
VGVRAKDGKVLWSNPFSAGNTANCPTPIFSDGYVFWANGYGKGGICLKLTVNGDEATAQEAWRTGDMVCHHGGYIVHEGYIYGNNGGGWSCLDLKTGERKWGERGVGKGSVCFADGMLYLFGERGGAAGLATCSPAGMQMVGNFNVAGSRTSWAHPVVIGGRLYLRYDVNLYCFDVKAP